ncbi:CLUMA_CG011901, isoform A [Clunio marinus]|uniref:CLUMA_CG011901, isoform A n=1 Tax=Clunio marinus TaxID=568069 RepID=A0A1J1IHN5_9DIPT|nr:CLUMA_CG011901, isoform A [Clunio marinus]
MMMWHPTFFFLLPSFSFHATADQFPEDEIMLPDKIVKIFIDSVHLFSAVSCISELDRKLTSVYVGIRSYEYVEDNKFYGELLLLTEITCKELNGNISETPLNVLEMPA